MDLSKFRRVLTTMHNSIAEDSAFDGAILHCDKCSRERQLQTALVPEYLRHGWPECCGHTMRLVTKREQDAAKTAKCAGEGGER